MIPKIKSEKIFENRPYAKLRLVASVRWPKDKLSIILFSKEYSRSTSCIRQWQGEKDKSKNLSLFSCAKLCCFHDVILKLAICYLKHKRPWSFFYLCFGEIIRSFFPPKKLKLIFIQLHICWRELMPDLILGESYGIHSLIVKTLPKNLVILWNLDGFDFSVVPFLIILSLKNHTFKLNHKIKY